MTAAKAAGQGPRTGMQNRLVGLLFLSIGVVALYFFGIQPVLLWWRAQSWIPVTCMVLESEVRRQADEDSVLYEAYIRYAYTHEGVRYESTRIHFRDGAASEEYGRLALVEAFPAGAEAVCYVDPDNPDQAILLRTFSGLYLIGFPGLLFIAAGLFLMVPQKPWEPEKNLAKRPPAGDFPPKRHMVVRPKRQGSVGADLFAFLFLNGVALVFVTITFFLVQDSGLASNFPFVLASGIFAAGAAGVGIVHLLQRAGRAGYALELEMTPGYLAPDVSASIGWRLRDRRRKTRELQIWLEARTLDSPDADTVSLDHGNVVDTLQIVSTFEHDDMISGNVQCSLPRNLRLPKGQAVCWLLCAYGATSLSGPALKAHHWIPVRDEP